MASKCLYQNISTGRVRGFYLKKPDTIKKSKNIRRYYSKKNIITSITTIHSNNLEINIPEGYIGFGSKVIFTKTIPSNWLEVKIFFIGRCWNLTELFS